MTTLDIVSQAITGASILLAGYSFVRNRLNKVREQTNHSMYRERLEGVYRALSAIEYSVDSMVQIPKTRTVTADELVDQARVVRGHLRILRDGLAAYRNQMKSWRFGRSDQSHPLVAQADERLRALEKGTTVAIRS